MREIEYRPQGVCSRLFKISVDDNNVIASIEVIGGCNGNLQAVSRLLVGLSVKEAIAKIEGIECRGSMTGKTSCPDQIAKALKTIN